MQAVTLDQSLDPAIGDQQQLPMVVIDYAHTPDAVSHALLALRSVASARGGQLWCVLGCGGDRDAGKRPQMAAAAQAAADQLMLTSDNPRSESPEAIVNDMIAGLIRPDLVRVQLDRARAVSEVLALVDVQDVVLVAGKGHETTQEIMGVFHPYSDESQVVSALKLRFACLDGVVQ
jgi:UDP-N-acetylmuramoyl-L-alanyl-D-glutamate--2,6-diaminopimelate ligase